MLCSGFRLCYLQFLGLILILLLIAGLFYNKVFVNASDLYQDKRTSNSAKLEVTMSTKDESTLSDFGGEVKKNNSSIEFANFSENP